MLKLALFFFIVSIIAGVFGFTGISAAAAGIAKILFFIFIVAFLIIGLVVGSALFKGRRGNGRSGAAASDAEKLPCGASHRCAEDLHAA